MFGLISLFSDLTYQAGRSLNGPLLGVLGADAALFIVLERASKAVRAPAKDTLLSLAARRVGTGRGFALHKVMDQVGAILDPLAMSLFLSGALGNRFQGLVTYQQAYALLWIPLVLMLVAALVGQRQVPDPPGAVEAPETLSRTFWIDSVFSFLAGIADLTPLPSRGTGYGLFNTINGLGLLASGALMGLLYGVSHWAVCWFSAAAEVAGLAVLVVLLRRFRPPKLPQMP